MSRTKILFVFALLLVTVLVGCDQFKDKTADPNMPPTVRFVNFPVDSTGFAYAPTIYWQGFDEDGFVTGFEFYDDTSAAGIGAYRESEQAWQNYLATLSESDWTWTDSASQRIYLLTEVNEVSEHIFLIRSIDDADARSSIAARVFFRSNQAPDAPQLRWAESDTTAYFVNEVIPDTQLVGDTLTLTYTGVRLLWKGSDPDSRSTNIIPLEYSYALVNSFGDSIALPVRNDSNHVTGYRAGWSNWGNESQIALYGLESGDYTFYLRVRDDGFTESDSMGTCTFTAVKPLLSRQLLIVDENKALVGPEAVRGGIHPDTLLAFYKGPNGNDGVVAGAMDIANTIAQYVTAPGGLPIRHFDYDSVAWLENRTGAVLPYDYISQFAVVWVINDDNVQTERSGPPVAAYNKVLSDYMDIGGGVMLTGRRVFNKSQGLPPGNNATNSFLRDYFNIFTVRPKSIFNSTQPAAAGITDFVGAVASDPQYPDLEIDPTMIDRLVYISSHVAYPPEIEYFGRSTTPASFDFATTLYNYKSTTADTSLYPNQIIAADCDVDTDTNWTTPTTVVIIPLNESLPLLAASRIYNVTRGVFADFMEVRNISDNLLDPEWRIFASIPIESGPWLSSDVLEVTYRFIPLSSDHDEPIGLDFVKYAGTIDVEINGSEIRTRVQARPVFRSCYFTFPFAYMKNDMYELHPFLPPVPAVSLLIANQLVFFNQDLDVNFN
ncbi:MAG: hypothetical protein KDB65_10930 [Calditrichaeota bacterium]|nr:hypothetical protein [Calditrichota bacterium]